MAFIYGLAVFLVIFDGIIIQCEGAGGESSQKRTKMDPINVINDDEPFLMHDTIELIVSKTDMQTVRQAVRSGIVSANEIVMSRILKDDVIFIRPYADQLLFEYKYMGETILQFGSNEKLSSFFNKFGDKIKKLGIEVYLQKDDIPHPEIGPNIIKKYGKNLEELRITGTPNSQFWQEISDGQNDIIFPNVKAFQFWGWSIQSVLKLNSMFPKLECLRLVGFVDDETCLDNVTGLKELILHTYSINEDHFDRIFKNNVNLTRLYLTAPSRPETMYLISKHLTKLSKLEIDLPGKQFLFRTNNNQPVYSLPTVTHLVIACNTTDEVIGIGNLSFDMPHLKELTISANITDDRIVEFVKQFEKLEKLELSLKNYDAIECIGELKHIVQFQTITYQGRFESLKTIFENFDDETKLQTVKFLDKDETTFDSYEIDMKKFNIILKDASKPTWTLSRGDQIGTDLRYLKFKRDPRT